MNWYEFCDCVATTAVASLDIVKGDVGCTPEELAADPAAANNRYYSACNAYAYAYAEGAAGRLNGIAINNAGFCCDEYGTAIDQEMWDRCYEFKNGRVVRRPGVSIDDEWNRFIVSVRARWEKK